MRDIIIAQNLSYSYETGDDSRTLAIDGLDLSIQRGSFTAILGHNGSGKSTLARQFNAVLLPSGGRVLVDGMETKNEALLLEIRRRIGIVFQTPDNQIVSNVVEEDVAFAPENLGVPSGEIRERVDSALKAVGMYDFRLHAPHLLSGGQKQRVAIAGVLAMGPECIVFDEPTAMLDPQGRADVVRIIHELRDSGKVTVVLITHHMEEAVGADRVVVMDHGRLKMDGTPAEVFSRVEELRALGLEVPETTRLLYELNQRGCQLPLDALSPDDCAGAIYAMLTEGRES